MDWIDAYDPNDTNEFDIEDNTGLPFCKSSIYYPDHYEWGLTNVFFRTLTDFQLFSMTFSMRFKGRVGLGTCTDYGIEEGYYVFRSSHPYLILHFYTHVHPLMIMKEEPVAIDHISMFSPNRTILQLVLKGIRLCATIEDETNYTE